MKKVDRSPFQKIVHPCIDEDTKSRVFCKIQWDGARLSISGVVGPKSNGDAHGSCGQMVDSFTPGAFAEGWSPRLLGMFRTMWHRWHLNDMRAGCCHQREKWDATEEVEIVTYRMTMETLTAHNAVKKLVEEKVSSDGKVKLSKAMQDLFNLPFETTKVPDADGAEGGGYKVHKREKKTVGWLSPSEHPKGILGKACPECGYKYGTSWLKEEIPDSVLEFFRELPTTTLTPAWC